MSTGLLDCWRNSFTNSATTARRARSRGTWSDAAARQGIRFHRVASWMTISSFAIAFRLMQINRPAAEGLALVDRSIPNGRELMHIKVATLGGETLVEFYAVLHGSVLCGRTLGMRPAKAPDAMLTGEDIMHLCGELPDWKIARILTSDATYEDSSRRP